MALVAARDAWDAPGPSKRAKVPISDIARQAVYVVRAHIAPRDVTRSKSASKTEVTPEVTEAFREVISSGKAQELYQDFLDEVEDHFFLVRNEIDVYIRRIEDASQTSDQDRADKIMMEMLERLALWQRQWGLPLKAFGDPKLVPQFTTVFHQLLHAYLPDSFPALLKSFLQASLNRVAATSPDPKRPSKGISPSPHLSRLGIIPRYSATLSQVAYEEIERIAKEEAAEGWDVRRLATARQKVGERVATWLSGIFEGNETAQNALKPMYSRFDYHLCRAFFDIRTDELFDIIVDYPDSAPALEDLKECLFKVDQRSLLVDKLKAANLKRLLHPGAETKDVITQYISTIRCLRILDPPGVLLHKVAEPIRRHLRDRNDTIKCIVATLVEGEELQDENEPGGAGPIRQGNDEGVEDFLDPKWEPEPVDAAPEFRSGKASDIISTLVSIYETREVIIKELQVLLATRLLAVKDYDAVKEIRIVELLKIRFGEAALQVCDVMLKDMADSKRINDHVHGDIKSKVHPLVISRMFWPNIQPSPLHLPKRLQKSQADYESAFHRFKPDKHLKFLQHLGTVTVKLELADRVVEVEATPLQASIAELFEHQDVWTIPDLGLKLGVDDEEIIRNALAWWATQGVVKMQGDTWILLERADGNAVENAPVVVEEDGVIDRLDEDKAEQIQAYWPQIKAALSQLGPLPLDAIQGMLRTMEGYVQTVEELEMFLSIAKENGWIVLRSDGRYVLGPHAK